MRQLDEIREAQGRSSVAHNDLRIGRDQVCPLRRNGANGRPINLQQQALPVAVVALAHAGELLPTERVERVGYTDKAHRSGGKACISD
jgi:hypothetical protein